MTQSVPSTDSEPTREAASSNLLHWTLYQCGFVQLHHASIDIKLLLAQRYIRVTAFGAMALILVAYLRLIGISEARIGYFMTATLLGDVAVSMLLATYGDVIGRRLVLIIGCSCMTASGLTFAFSGNYWLLLSAAVFGVITPSGSDLGPFRIIEESTISHLTRYEDRPTIYAFYVMCGRWGAASGMLFCGLAMHYLQDDRGWSTFNSYRVAFIFYAISGVVKLFLTLCLSGRCDETRTVKLKSQERPDTPPLCAIEPEDETETAPLLGIADKGLTKGGSRGWSRLSILSQISEESRRVCLVMCFLVCFEYIGNAMASLSWLAYYFQKMYGMSTKATGRIFFTSQIGGGIMAVIGGAVARRVGNIETVFGVAVIANVGFVVLGLATSLPVSIAAVIIRDSVQQAEGGAMLSFSVNLFLPSERTAALGFMAVFKTLASSIGPSLTGLLVESNHYWLVFIIAGCVKMIYASGLLVMFRKYKVPEEREAEAAKLAAEEDGEEVRCEERR